VTDRLADPAPVYDLFQAADDRVLASVSRATGDIGLVSRLDDGRLLSTTSLLVPPIAGLVANTAPAAEPAVLLGLHHQALAAYRVRAELTTARAFREVMDLERQAYAQLGPLLGGFYDPGRRRGAPMTVPVSPQELLEVTLPSA